MTDDEINSGLFGHKQEATISPQGIVQAPISQLVNEPKKQTRSTSSAPTSQAQMPDVTSLVNQASEAQKELVKNVDQPKTKPALESLNEAYPWLGYAGAAIGSLIAGKTIQSLFGSDNGEKPKSSGISERTIRKEPTLDVGLTPANAIQLEKSFPQFDGPANTPTEIEAIKNPTSVVETPKVAPTGVPTPQTYQGSGLQQPSMTYGETTLNAPTGAPSPLGSAPPASSNQPVVPSPLNDKQRLEKARADLAEFKLKQAMDAATSTQKQQGKPLSDADSNLLKQSNKNTMDKANEAALKAASKPQPVPPVPTAPAAPMVETPMASPVTAAPDIAAVPPPTAEASTQATTTETKKPAKSKAIPTFKTEADLPKDTVFRPDVGNLDRSLANILGTEGRLYAKDVLNEGKMFGNYKGSDYNKKVGNLVSAYGEELKKITPSIDLTTRDGRIAAGLPHTQNYGPALGKAAKVGGVLGTLMTVAQSANAKEALGNVAESLLPIGMTPSELQSGKLTAKQLKAFEEAQKLGSPYRSVPPPTR